MSPVRVVDEIEYIVKKYHKTRFTFTDNSYEDPNNDLGRQREIAKEIIRRQLCIGYCVSYKTDFYKYCTTELMNLLLASGLYSIFIGFEAGNDEDLRLYRKACTVADNDAAIRFYKTFEDLNIVLGFINFNPYTTVEKLNANLAFLRRNEYACDLSYFTSKLTPYKGTQLFEKLQRDGILTGDIYSRGYGYIYVDKEIEKLESYIFNVTHKYKILKDTRYICSTLPCILTELKNKAKFYKDHKAVDCITEARKNYMIELSALNQKMGDWLQQLINLTEKGWNEDQADIISREFMLNCDILKTLDKLKILRNKLYINLLRINPIYSVRF